MVTQNFYQNVVCDQLAHSHYASLARLLQEYARAVPQSILLHTINTILTNCICVF